MPIDPKYLSPFIPGEFYHVYNQSPSNKKMFIEEKNYCFFLHLIKKYLLAWIDLYTYCLIPNHFHLFIRIKDTGNAGEMGSDVNRIVTNQFRKLFIAYANTINKEYGTHGGVFSRPFKRILITSEAYFSQLIFYIHCNATHHNICAHPSKYRFSSYNSILSNKPTLLRREEVLDWFGGKESFISSHETMTIEFSKLPFYIE